jgi:hypothetical protein
MKSCEQTKGQSIYEHCWSVWEYFQDLHNHLRYGNPLEYTWKLPDWIYTYKEELLEKLLYLDTIEEYLKFHDCSKPFIKTTDINGKVHFPNHAEKSSEIWLQAGGSKQSAELIRMDMEIHTINADDLCEFCSREECITLLLSGLAEIHSNAEMFGGIGSTSFKIKWKQIDRRGRAICKKLFTQQI